MKNFTIIINLVLLLLSGSLEAATTVRKYWQRASESPYEVQMAKTADAWGDPDNAVGVWDGDELAYYFEIDLEDFDQWDATSTYKIMENAAVVFSNLMLGDISVADTLRNHREAVSGVHGTTGDVVGETDTQTLTNKTIDGDDNTLQDLPGSVLVHDPVLSGLSVQPEVGVDSYYNVTYANSSGVAISATDAAGTTYKGIQTNAGHMSFTDGAGGDMEMWGLAPACSSDSPVIKAQLDSLKVRVDDLERDDTFSGGATINLNLYSGRYSVFARFSMGTIADRDSVKRYEIYWRTGEFEVPAGSGDQKRGWLQQNCSRVILRSGEGSTYNITTDELVSVVVIAIDWGIPATLVFSSVESATPRDIGGLGRDQAGEVIDVRRVIGTSVHMAAGATGDAAAAFTEYTQSDATPTLKYRCAYVFHTDDVRMQLYFYGKTGADAADHGYIRLDVKDASSTVKSETYVIDYDVSGYPAVPQMIDIDLSSGVTDEMLYDVQVSIWSDATHDTVIKQIQIEVVAEVPVY